MLESKQGFTIVQFIAGMTVAGLLLVGLFVYIAKGLQRENQRKSDLGTISAMLDRYAENHLGKYPLTKQASRPGTELQIQFNGLRLIDPKTEQYYVLGGDFEPCNGGADTIDHGPGYVSYKSPGDDNEPYTLRICLEHGEYYGN